MTILRTQRLVLRPWTDADRGPFAAMNADPVVMEHFPSVQDRATSDGFVDRIQAHWAEHGFGPFAVDDPDGFVGFVGLLVPNFVLPAPHLAEPPVEIGWRLCRAAWGKGYATEAGRAVCARAFGNLQLPELVSFTALANRRSRAVMKRLGMTHDPVDDFDHPLLEGSALQRHVLYRLRSDQWDRLGS